jgi:hypothetical protein
LEKEVERMEVKDTLAAALKAVTEAEIPAELREVAFAKAVDLLAAKIPAAPANGTSGAVNDAATPAEAQSGGQTVAPSGVSALDRIATKLGVDRELVEEVFAETDGSIDITVSPRKLAPAKQEASRQIALLITAGRQAAGVEERTATDVIRAKCEEFRKLDPTNFGKAIGGMHDEFSFQGPPRKRLVKLSRQGWPAAVDLVKRLTGEAES